MDHIVTYREVGEVALESSPYSLKTKELTSMCPALQTTCIFDVIITVRRNA